MATLIKSNSSALVSGFVLGPVLPLNSFWNVLLFLFNILLATSIVFLNVSVFVSILLNRALRKENRFMYMLSTCLSDFFTGVSYYYCGALDVHDDYDSPTRTYFIVPAFLGLSLMAILAAQADRYHAVSSPFKYSQRMTRGRTLVVIALYWLDVFVMLTITDLVPPGIAGQVTGFSTLVVNIFIVVVMIVLNVRLFLIARYQLDREPPSAERENKRKSVYLIVVVAMCFLICWLPILLFIITSNFLGTTHFLFRNEGSDPMRILQRVSALLTPVLYIRGCAGLRVTLFTKVWRVCCRHTGLSPGHQKTSVTPNILSISMMSKTWKNKSNKVKT